jgi:hypothetical protein
MNNDRQNLQEIKTKLDNIERRQLKQEQLENLHPILFVILFVAFFITMDLWSTTVNSFLTTVHPRGYLYFWEYLIIALFAAGLLYWALQKTGFQMQVMKG